MRQTCSLCGNVFDDKEKVDFCSKKCKEAHEHHANWAKGKPRVMTSEQKERFRKSLDPYRRRFTEWEKKFKTVRG